MPQTLLIGLLKCETVQESLTIKNHKRNVYVNSKYIINSIIYFDQIIFRRVRRVRTRLTTRPTLRAGATLTCDLAKLTIDTCVEMAFADFCVKLHFNMLQKIAFALLPSPSRQTHALCLSGCCSLCQ